MELKIKRITRKSTGADDKPYVDKNGRKFMIVNIEVDSDAYDHPEFNGWISFFDNSEGFTDSEDWVEGTVLEGVIKENVKGDKTYFNFRKPSGTDLLTERFNKLEDRVAVLETAMMLQKPKAEEEKEEPSFDEDLPF